MTDNEGVPEGTNPYGEPPPIEKKSPGKIILLVVGAILVMMLVCCGGLVAIATPGFLKARETSRMKACTENLIRLDAAKMQWALDNNITEDEVAPVMSDLAPYLPFEPRCPAGGTYTLGTLGEVPDCTISGHDFPY